MEYVPSEQVPHLLELRYVHSLQHHLLCRGLQRISSLLYSHLNVCFTSNGTWFPGMCSSSSTGSLSATSPSQLMLSCTVIAITGGPKPLFWHSRIARLITSPSLPRMEKLSSGLS